MVSSSHLLDRTSPEGEKFVGTCRQCGKSGLKINDVISDICQNPLGTSYDAGLLDAMQNPKEKR
jgi:hypothetical protein